MFRASLVLAAVLSGCSLQVAGTAETFDFADATVEDTSVVARDTFVPVPEDTFVPPDTFVAEDAAEVDAALDAFDAGCPSAKSGATPCDTIPRREALATGQAMDGRADDFCDVPYVDFDNDKGAIRDPSSISGPARTTMRIRVAWSTYGLHAHLSVKDDTLLPLKPLTDKRVYLGDSVEIYVAAHDMMTGTFDGVSKDFGAQQIIITAPDSTTMSRAVYFYNGTPASSPDISRWAARIVTDVDYEIELRLPWDELKHSSMTSPTTGSRIALTWAFNNKYNTTASQAFSVFQVKAPPTSTPCPGGTAQAFCDDRLWCTPTLL